MSFGSSSLQVFLLLVFLSFSPISEGFIEKADDPYLVKLCSQTINPSFCLKALKSDPRTSSADIKGLAQISVDLASATAKKTYTMIGGLIKQETGQLKARYLTCSKYYGDAIHNLEDAKLHLNSGKSLNDRASSALNLVEDCQDEFEVPPAEPSSLRESNQNVVNLCSIILAISNQLTVLS